MQVVTQHQIPTKELQSCVLVSDFKCSLQWLRLLYFDLAHWLISWRLASVDSSQHDTSQGARVRQMIEN